MTFVPPPPIVAQKDKWSFSADRAGKWRWALTTPERLVLRESSEAYATRADAVKNASQYGYHDPSAASSGSSSYPGLKRNQKMSSKR